MNKKVSKLSLIALVFAFGIANIERVSAEEIQIGRQTFSLKPNLTYKIVKDKSKLNGQLATHISGIAFLKAQLRKTLHKDPNPNARDCGNCQVLYNSANNQYYAIFPRFTLGLRLGVNRKELRAKLEKISAIDINHINDNFAWLSLRDQKQWISAYEQLQKLKAYTRFVLPEIKSHLAQAN